MVGKKGMSPIIATILLIAFAVALGAMIMNWSSSLVAGGEKESLCQSATINLRQPLCYQDNKVKVNLMNNGETTISAIQIKIISEEADQSIQLRDSMLEPRQSLIKSVPAVKPGTSFEAQIIPMVTTGEGGEPEACTQILHTTNELPPCQ